jgi:hypothetical protein
MPPLLDLSPSTFALLVEAIQLIPSPAEGDVHVLPE